MRLDDRRRALVNDVLLGVGMLLLVVGSVAGTAPESGQRPLDNWAYALLAVQTLPLVWRRRAPVAVMAVIVAGFIIDRGLNYPASWAPFGISVAMYTVGAQIEPRRSLLIGGVTMDIVLLWTAIGIWVYDIEWIALLSVAAFLGFPLLVGRESYNRQQRLIDLEARAVRAEVEREQRAIDAVIEERTRIARELHDIVAHEVTVMTIQAAAARRVLDEHPGQAAEAMESAEGAGHRALAEMRRLLGMLRTSVPDTAPQPGLAALHGLVEQMQLAGLSVKLRIEGKARELPVGIDLNAYRIIQESLTNTLKHGGPHAQAEVAILYHDESVVVEVTDDGRGAAAAESNGERGQGLLGMRERIALLEGTLSAGPRRGGGYRVAAEIPIPA